MALPEREIDTKGWLLIAKCTLGVAVSVIPVSILTLGVFMKPLGAEFGWGRGETAAALALLSLAMAAAMPVAGRLIDRYGVRQPLLASLLVYGASVALLPFAITTFGLAGFYALFLWFGAAGAASSSVAYVKILSGWFNRSRGLALGFAMSGIALGGAIAPLIAALLIKHFGWEAGFYGLALMPLLIGIPVGLRLPEPQSARTPGAAAGRPPAAEGLSTGEAMRTRTFWILFLLFLVIASAIHGIQIHLAPLLSDRGLPPEYAALGVSFMFGISVATRLVAGYLFDRVFAPWIGAACFLAAGIGAAVLIPGSAPDVAVLVAVMLLGVGAGAESDLLAFLVSRYFGLRAFGAIYGWIFAAFMAGSALGPFFLGVSFDATGGYETSLIMCTIGLAVSTLLLLILPRYPRWRSFPVAGAEAEAPAIA